VDLEIDKLMPKMLPKLERNWKVLFRTTDSSWECVFTKQTSDYLWNRRRCGKDWFEKLSWCFLERHFAKETKTKWVCNYEPRRHFWKWDTLGRVVQAWKQ